MAVDTAAAARRVHRTLDEFLGQLDSDVSDAEFKKLLFGKATLNEVELEYKPEAYTRYNLVEPLLEAVELTYQLEPRSVGVHRKRWPDLRLTSTGIPYIGEVKALNNAERGREEIKEYLGIEGFVSPYGMLTDGVEWVVYGPSAEGGRKSSPVERTQRSLNEALQTVALTEEHWEMDLLSGAIQSEGIRQIESFPELFMAEKLDVWALEKMPAEYRADFLTQHQELQTSLDWDWE
ncbi:hypothetical protein G9463_23445 [Haloarcula sp. JP-Z28]|uniref:hypothetical protein n=1 Tax=Haloarcula sp. JP-Z28 TaxID=2716715 RepID=UPI00140559AC|nr:hypothetical protein [Haloarcula sp. JP-Z28]NHN66159.1 hypothetical protein [Haloarcula sp. JP-Z28]